MIVRDHTVTKTPVFNMNIISAEKNRHYLTIFKKPGFHSCTTHYIEIEPPNCDRSNRVIFYR